MATIGLKYSFSSPGSGKIEGKKQLRRMAYLTIKGGVNTF